MRPLLLYISILATVSAAWLPLLPRMEPGGSCGEYVDTDMLDDLDGPTADGTAGLGIEFESAGFYFRKDGCSLADTNAAKGKIISGHTGNNWELTADTGSGAGDVHAEYILNGKNIKVGDGSAAEAASAAAQDLINWKPWTGNRKGSIQIEDNNCNPWDIGGPSIRQDPNKLPWEPQVTAPMPLEALYSLMKEQVLDPLDPDPRNVLNGICTLGDCIILVTDTYFQSKPNNIDGTKLTDDVFGFLTLVLSYAKAAKTKKIEKDRSPKQLLSFMPRTEFNTIYGQVKSKIPGDLFTLLDTLACYTTTTTKGPDGSVSLEVNLDKTFCSGILAKPVSKNVLAGANFQNPGGNPASVNIKAWIQGIGAQSPSPDLLTAYDKGIDNSIGGLGTTMEKMFDSQRSVPLFEFRSLFTMQTTQATGVDGLESFAKKADSAVQALHKQFANPPGRKMKRQASGSCSLITPPTSVLSPSPTTAAPSVSCQYQDGTPEQSEACTCVSGSSTTVVQPMTLSSVSIITQSCDYTTWPGDKPAVTSPPATVSTNFAGCQVCTIVGPNEDNCSPLPSSLGCTPKKPSTVLTADTSGVTVGTLTGSALYSAITSGLDQVCQVPPNNGATSAYSCTENATATLAPDVVYYDKGVGEAQFKFDGSLTLQVTEANYDSLEWYATNKAILAAMAQNSTQNNCKSDNGIWQTTSEERRTISLCQVGSNFQLTEIDPSSSDPARELSFNLRFQTDTEGSIVCEFLADVVEFIETTIAVETDTEASLPEELKVDQKLLAACEKAGIGSKF